MGLRQALCEIIDGGLVAVVAIDKEHVERWHIGKRFWQSRFKSVVNYSYIVDAQLVEAIFCHLRKRWATFDGYNSFAVLRIGQIERS